MIIVFEGLDGAGKSSSIDAYAKHLRSLGYTVLTTQEPGGTEAAFDIRSLVKTTPMEKRSQTMLFAAARYENHVSGNIGAYVRDMVTNPNLILLIDRYEASTYIYQDLINDPVSAAVYEEIAHNYEFITPDIYVFFDVSFEESLRRRKPDARNTDVHVEDDVLERTLESESNFAKMRSDYRNFFVSKQLISSTAWVEVNTTDMTEEMKLQDITEKLNEHLIPISECAR